MKKRTKKLLSVDDIIVTFGDVGMERYLRATLQECLSGTSSGLPGIVHRHGRVLISGWDTVRPGLFYVVGLNPGGGVKDFPPTEETIGASLDQQPAQWNYFSDEATGSQATTVLSVFKALGAPPQQTLTTNALFVRSSGETALPPDAKTVWADYCKPTHEQLLSIVQPRLAVCFGIKAWTYLTGRRDPGHWNFDPGVQIRFDGLSRACNAVLIPHFSPIAQGTWKKHERAIKRAIAEAKDFIIQ